MNQSHRSRTNCEHITVRPLIFEVVALKEYYTNRDPF